MKLFILCLVLCLVCLFFTLPLLAQGGRETSQEIDDLWKFKNETTLNTTILTGDSDSVTLGGEEKFVAKKKTVTNTFTSGVTYVRDHVFNDAIPVKTASRDIFAKDKLLWEFYKRTYSYFGGGWLTNKTSGVDNQFDGFTGLGYKLLVLEKHNLNIEAGYRFEHQTTVVPTPDKRDSHNIALGFDYLWQMTESSSLENETDNLFDMESRDNINILSQTKLKVEIIKHLALSVGFKLRFDNTPVPTFKKWNTTSTTGLTLLF